MHTNPIGAGLKENHSIKFLSVRNCRISPIGIEAISEALIHNKTLDELNLSDNSIGNHGVSVICVLAKYTDVHYEYIFFSFR